MMPQATKRTILNLLRVEQTDSSKVRTWLDRLIQLFKMSKPRNYQTGTSRYPLLHYRMQTALFTTRQRRLNQNPMVENTSLSLSVTGVHMFLKR